MLSVADEVTVIRRGATVDTVDAASVTSRASWPSRWSAPSFQPQHREPRP
ncbi:hypothetical protein [Aeromicrobium sp. UC242_57]